MISLRVFFVPPCYVSASFLVFPCRSIMLVCLTSQFFPGLYRASGERGAWYLLDGSLAAGCLVFFPAGWSAATTVQRPSVHGLCCAFPGNILFNAAPIIAGVSFIFSWFLPWVFVRPGYAAASPFVLPIGSDCMVSFPEPFRRMHQRTAPASRHFIQAQPKLFGIRYVTWAISQLHLSVLAGGCVCRYLRTGLTMHEYRPGQWNLVVL